ncbi:MAG: hypothetical protein JXR03_04255 [Cyclobacteriaceae bacterium]
MKHWIIIAFAAFVFACEETDSSPECPDNAICISPEQLAEIQLDSLKQIILQAAKTQTCSESAECKFVGLGSKPCGGPWEYLIYSTNANEETLLSLVKSYNEKEEQLNIDHGRASDCAIAQAPDSVECGGDGCTAYLQEKAFTDGICCR